MQIKLEMGGNIKSLSELRREARLKRFVNTNIVDSHTAINFDAINIDTPIKLSIGNDNNRWYCNKLLNVPAVANSTTL